MAERLPVVAEAPAFQGLDLSMYSKQTETAIAALSRLAELYNGGEKKISVTEIANSRGLQRPFLAKILTTLSQARLVNSTPGPGGGFTLAKPPREISLIDIYRLFEHQQITHACPYGGGVCGSGTPCALHDKLLDVQQSVDRLLLETTLEGFQTVEPHRVIDRPQATHDIGQRRSFQPKANIPRP
ncbi:MAG: Rrf2 family transcriptional regulator [Phycisphaerales bacterium]